jgi:hypothetical protein
MENLLNAISHKYTGSGINFSSGEETDKNKTTKETNEKALKAREAYINLLEAETRARKKFFE